ncbi:SHOCT domain-containing protein [Pseudarthrobacter albicanus]|uniref:SHOCT domain-containing protein n=1 Tax=Pseudarthrobacter albicanus TaxID=2823873 RepID=UPI0027DC4007|nr:SHOCT domain-containing protein [Pseudarthrobacter albicanus]
MMGYGYGDMGLMWLWMLGWSVLLLAGLAALVWVIARLASGGGRSPDNRPGSARSILDERYARGEIDDEEYRTRRETLG